MFLFPFLVMPGKMATYQCSVGTQIVIGYALYPIEQMATEDNPVVTIWTVYWLNLFRVPDARFQNYSIGSHTL